MVVTLMISKYPATTGTLVLLMRLSDPKSQPKPLPCQLHGANAKQPDNRQEENTRPSSIITL